MNGYLSIERQNNLSDGSAAPHFLVFRDFAGNMHFTGLLNKSAARIKEMNEKELVFKLKIAVMCLDPSTRQYAREFLEIKFAKDADRKAFASLFCELTGAKMEN